MPKLFWLAAFFMSGFPAFASDGTDKDQSAEADPMPQMAQGLDGDEADQPEDELAPQDGDELAPGEPLPAEDGRPPRPGFLERCAEAIGDRLGADTRQTAIEQFVGWRAQIQALEGRLGDNESSYGASLGSLARMSLHFASATLADTARTIDGVVRGLEGDDSAYYDDAGPDNAIE